MSADVVALFGRRANAAEFNDALETAALNRFTEGGKQILALERTGRGSGKCLRLLADFVQ
jgi:hypothetical protein